MRTLGVVLGLGLMVGCATAKPASTSASTSAEHHDSAEAKIDPAGAVKAFDHPPKPGEKAICAVSGEVFYVTESTPTAQYNGKYYAFCCDDCAPSFKENPAKYVQ